MVNQLATPDVNSQQMHKETQMPLDPGIEQGLFLSCSLIPLFILKKELWSIFYQHMWCNESHSLTNNADCNKIGSPGICMHVDNVCACNCSRQHNTRNRASVSSAICVSIQETQNFTDVDLLSLERRIYASNVCFYELFLEFSW